MDATDNTDSPAYLQIDDLLQNLYVHTAAHLKENSRHSNLSHSQFGRSFLEIRLVRRDLTPS